MGCSKRRTPERWPAGQHEQAAPSPPPNSGGPGAGRARPSIRCYASRRRLLRRWQVERWRAGTACTRRSSCRRGGRSLEPRQDRTTAQLDSLGPARCSSLPRRPLIRCCSFRMLVVVVLGDTAVVASGIGPAPCGGGVASSLLPLMRVGCAGWRHNAGGRWDMAAASPAAEQPADLLRRSAQPLPRTVAARCASPFRVRQVFAVCFTDGRLAPSLVELTSALVGLSVLGCP